MLQRRAPGGYTTPMRNRVAAVVLSLFSLLLAVCACAQNAKWQRAVYDKWGFTVQLPAGAQKQAISDQPQQGFYDVYSVGGMACVVAVTPGQDNLPGSTVIEQVLQGEVKKVAKLGLARRWEQDSKQGDLFKGLIGSVQIKGSSDLPSVVGRIVAADTGFECISMATLGDEASPILSIGIIGPKSREAEIIAISKSMVAFVTRTESAPSPPPVVDVPKPRKLVPELKPVAPPKPVAKPDPKPDPKPTPKPWPTLKQGEIELTGVVDAISPDHRSVTVIVDSIKLPGQDPIELSPAHTKKVLLRQKLSWLAAGQRIRLLGKNTGVGKPMTADSLEKCPDRPADVPLRPRVSIPA